MFGLRCLTYGMCHLTSATLWLGAGESAEGGPGNRVRGGRHVSPLHEDPRATGAPQALR